jgi:hypothetical protein
VRIQRREPEKQGAQIPEGIEEALINDLFVPEDFEDLVLEAAADNSAVGKLLRELQEPRPAGQDCIPWLGETAMKERILRCARGARSPSTCAALSTCSGRACSTTRGTRARRRSCRKRRRRR